MFSSEKLNCQQELQICSTFELNEKLLKTTYFIKNFQKTFLTFYRKPDLHNCKSSLSVSNWNSDLLSDIVWNCRTPNIDTFARVHLKKWNKIKNKTYSFSFYNWTIHCSFRFMRHWKWDQHPKVLNQTWKLQ
jgi:hypothetical protein